MKPIKEISLALAFTAILVIMGCQALICGLSYLFDSF